MTKRYKSEEQFLLECRTRFYVISCILEIMMRKLYFEKKEWISFSEIISEFFKNHSNPDTERNATVAQIEINLPFMNWMQLLNARKSEDGVIEYALTEDGLQAYKMQSFHNTAANLYYAKQNKRIATWAFFVAIASMLMTFLAIVVDIQK